jgi:hypothetical protein
MDVPLPNVNDTERKASTLPVLKEALLEHYSKRRPGVHVSDLNGCLRKKVFETIDPRELDDKALNNFSSGRGIDGAVEDLTYIKRDKYKQKPELWISHKTGDPIFWYDAGPDDICAHPDIWDTEMNIPIEGKSNKTETVWLDKFDTMNSPPPASNVKQLLYYMAMANKTYGRLLIQYVNQKKQNPWREIDYKQTPDELKALRQEMIEKAAILKIAKEAKDPSIAPHIMDDKDQNYLCKICPYSKECLGMIRKAIKQKEHLNISKGFVPL